MESSIKSTLEQEVETDGAQPDHDERDVVADEAALG
jgi:hypothetical protein